MAVGIILGNFVPNTGPALQKGRFVGVSVPIGESAHFLSTKLVGIRDVSREECLTRVLAVGLLVMMYPILCKIKFESLHLVFRQREIWVQIGFSVLLNWIIAPFLMVYFPSLLPIARLCPSAADRDE